MQTQFRTAVDALRLRDLDKDWDAISIITDVGVSENTIQLLAKRIRAVNGKRPAANRKTADQMCERFLEWMRGCSTGQGRGRASSWRIGRSALR